MKSHTKNWRFIFLTFATLLSISAFYEIQKQPEPLILGGGNPQTLAKALSRWEEQQQQKGGLQQLDISLNYSRAYSQETTAASGFVSLNLLTGQLISGVKNLPKDRTYSLWLIGKKNGAFTELNMGNLQPQNEKLELNKQLNRNELVAFHLERVAITTADATPQEKGLLFGSVGLLQKTYFNQQLWSIAKLSEQTQVKADLPFAFLLPKMAVAAGESLSMDEILAQKIAKGRDLFVNEKFNGNGRTCATCHRPDNNHTIDPVYISKLPKTDPLFVAENNPELKDLENSKLLRQYGLILANIDGFDKPPVFRAPPATLGLINTIIPEAVDVLGQAMAVDENDPNHTHDSTTGSGYDTTGATHMLGWSGDGSPGDGSLRMFAQGAITQHAPKTLNRKEGLDFRLATEDELDAIEAYMISLGRSEELMLNKMHFKSPLADRGKELFNSKFDEGTGKCLGCHNNAGANSMTTTKNGNRDTGIENMELNPARLTVKNVAIDGGFGKNKREDCGALKDQECYGDGKFNMASVIEAADTAPYFHNNSIATLEEAIASYNSDAFNNSPGAVSEGRERKIKIDSTKVTAIAAFLRSINVLENIRNSNALDGRALYEKGAVANETIKLAMADTEDAIQVMEQSGYNISPEALTALRDALDAETKALKALSKSTLLKSAMSKKETAKTLLVSIDK